MTAWKLHPCLKVSLQKRINQWRGAYTLKRPRAYLHVRPDEGTPQRSRTLLRTKRLQT